jgi:hypothetical protein
VKTAGWVGPTVGLDVVEKREIPCSSRESKARLRSHSCHYTDWATPESIYERKQIHAYLQMKRLWKCDEIFYRYRGSGVRFLAGAGNFSLHNRVQNGSGAHPASYPMGIGGSFSGCKAAGASSWPLTSF